jgi:hypothetical protein
MFCHSVLAGLLSSFDAREPTHRFTVQKGWELVAQVISEENFVDASSLSADEFL